MILSCDTTPGQRVLGRDGNEGVYPIPESSSITENPQSDCLESYPEYLLQGFLSPLT